MDDIWLMFIQMAEKKNICETIFCCSHFMTEPIVEQRASQQIVVSVGGTNKKLNGKIHLHFVVFHQLQIQRAELNERHHRHYQRHSVPCNKKYIT